MRQILLLMLTWTAFASESLNAQEAADVPGSGRQIESEQKPVPASETSSDEELLKELVPGIPLGKSQTGTSPVPEEDALDQTVRSMRRASHRIEQADLSEDTRELQMDILAGIDALIDRLQSQPPAPPQPPRDSQSETKEQQQAREQTSAPQNSADSPPQPDSKQQPSGQSSRPQTENKQAAESSEENQRKARARATTLARRRALINEVWGHLPPTLREKLLNVGSEKLLPQYEELIRRYYESLANRPDSPAR